MRLLAALTLAVALTLRASADTVNSHVQPCVWDCYLIALQTEPCGNFEGCCGVLTFIKRIYECLKSRCTREVDEPSRGWGWLREICARTPHPIPPEFVIPRALAETTMATSDPVSPMPSISTALTTTATSSKNSSISTPTATSDYYTGEINDSRPIKIAIGVSIPLAFMAALVTFLCRRRYRLQKKRNQSPEEQEPESESELKTGAGAGAGPQDPQNPPPDPIPITQPGTRIPATQPEPNIRVPPLGPIFRAITETPQGYIIELDGSEPHPARRGQPLPPIPGGILQGVGHDLNGSFIPPLAFSPSPTLARSSSSPCPTISRHPEAMRQQAQRARAPSPRTEQSVSTDSGSLNEDVQRLTGTLTDIQRRRTLRE